MKECEENSNTLMICDPTYTAYLPKDKSYSVFNLMAYSYYEAASELFGAIEKDFSKKNTLVFPLFFCERHSLELQIKSLTEEIRNLNAFRDGVKNNDEPSGHNLSVLLDELERSLARSDRRIQICSEKLDMKQFLSDFVFMDPSSETFRYGVDKHGKSLFQKEYMGIQNIYMSFTELYYFFDWMHDVVAECGREYYTGTFTKKLSRYELAYIAKQLPARAEWGSQEFMTIKNEVMSRFSLTSQNFSDALDLIQVTPFLCSLIGKEIPEGGFSDKFCMIYRQMKSCALQYGQVIHSLTSDRILPLVELHDNQDLTACEKQLDDYVNTLSLDDYVLFNTYRCIRYYGEEYDEIKTYFDDQKNKEGFREYTSGKMTANGFRDFEEGLQLCGRVSVLRTIGIHPNPDIDRKIYLSGIDFINQ